jgi:anti-anti-sigma regulatory factor
MTTSPRAGTTDHLCWIHSDTDADFDAAARAFLAGGLARGERLLCVGDRAIAAVRGDRPPLDGVDDLIAAGTLELLDITAAAGAFDADAQFAVFDAATRRALADGYTGLRVLAELTALATDPAHRPELVRWERLADDYVVHGPGMTAMCAYDADLPPEALTDVASVHPLIHGPSGIPPFRVFVDDDRIVLAGSVDTFDADRLAQVLAGSPATGRAVVDLDLLEFVDAAGCRVIARWAGDLRARGVPVEVRGASRMFRRIWHILALGDVAPVSFGGVAA